MPPAPEEPASSDAAATNESSGGSGGGGGGGGLKVPGSSGDDQPALKSKSKSLMTKSKSKLGLANKSALMRASKSNIKTGGGGGDDDDEWVQQKEMVKPDNQLELTDDELKKEFTRILRAENPHAPDNIVRFSHKESEYRSTSTVDHTAIHFSLDGSLLWGESDEARRQRAKENLSKGRPKMAEGGTQTEEGEDEDEGQGEEEEAEEEEAAEGEEAAEEAAPPAPAAEEEAPQVEEKVLRNQFNFSERASQTFNRSTKVKECQTEPPPRATFSYNVTQWDIYDAYIQDQARQKAAKEKANTRPHRESKKTAKKHAAIHQHQEVHVEPHVKILKADDVKKIERIVNQNTFNEVLIDYKYYEDESDEFKGSSGTCLPLWKFANENANKRTVTGLCFNPRYHDLFAVGYGSYDYLKQEGGLVAIYSCKNPSWPEFMFRCDAGVMCLDWHPESNFLLAVGFYDGNVAVFDVRSGGSGPVYQSTAKTGKHSEPVWQVKWQADTLDKHKNFCSVSSDGTVSQWVLILTDLQKSDIVALALDESETPVGAEDTPVFGLGCGTAFAFHRKTDHLFVVGTEEGVIRKCSKTYTSHFLQTYKAHDMSVYNIRWNYFHDDYFITCSEDWTIKIWDHNSETPIFVFDLGNPVGDVAWAPYASCTFAAVTQDGRVFVYDLSIDKYEPLCAQQICKKAKLTHVEFNPSQPTLIIGDDKGCTMALKLSPNLRKRPKKWDESMEVEKLQRVVASVREPTS